MDTILGEAKTKMGKAIEVVRNDLSSIRSGRATPALVQNIVISAYSGSQRLRVEEMATITSQDAKSILITPFDPSAIDDIVRGIQESHSGLNPVRDGDVVRISIPPLSQEQREEYIKLANTKLEGGKIMIRQIRHEAMKDLEKEKAANLMTEDMQKIGEKKIQELTDEMIKSIDDIGKKKEAELLQV